jgi:L-ascorbate metabolism protein UlaG (beta-lactamase superfamily)
MKITWYGTASLIVEIDGCRIALDPYISRNPRLPGVDPHDLAGVKAVLVTHGHFDHAADIPSLLNDLSVPVYAPAETVEALSSRPCFTYLNLHGVEAGEVFEVEGLRITSYPACHVKFDPPLILRTLLRVLPELILRPRPLFKIISDYFKYPQGRICAWEIKSGSKSILIFGSMGLDPEQNYPSPDVLVLPLQGHSSIEKLALEAAMRIKPSIIMPHHFDDSFPPISSHVDISVFADMLKSKMPGVEVIIPCHRKEMDIRNN